MYFQESNFEKKKFEGPILTEQYSKCTFRGNSFNQIFLRKQFRKRIFLGRNFKKKS